MSETTQEEKGESEEEEFDYGGELVFNGIIRTDVKKDEPGKLKNQIIDNLAEFERGNPGAEGSGRINLDLEHYSEEESLPSELKDVAKKIIGIEYRYEEYPNDPVEVVRYDDDGKPQHGEAFQRKTRSVFLYWDYPQTIFVQGAKTRVEEVTPKVNTSLGENVDFTYHEFDEEFLLWLVLKDKHSEPLNSDIAIDQLRASEITGGDPADFGRDAEVDQSDDISQSLPILAGILKDMDIAMLEGDFTLDDKYEINVKFHSDGRVRLYANRDLSDSSKLKRALISNLFLSELLSEYREWTESSQQDKYPHPRYFKDLHDEANRMGANYAFNFTGLVHRYAELRNEDPSNYDFEFEVYEPDEDND